MQCREVPRQLLSNRCAEVSESSCVETILWIRRLDAEDREEARLLAQHGLVRVLRIEHVRKKRGVPVA
jgi:hypothetical protein